MPRQEPDRTPFSPSDRRTVFSPDRAYRYTLWRKFDLDCDRYAMFIGLNPSTADETHDDPTVRRCIDFAKRWGFGALCITNIFAFRATDPRRMKKQANPVGPRNDEALQACARDAGIVVAAWGVHGAWMDRDRVVADMLPNLRCLGFAKGGAPRHPLYVPARRKPVPLDPSPDETGGSLPASGVA